jgi:succinate-acetate transporter protein
MATTANTIVNKEDEQGSATHDHANINGATPAGARAHPTYTYGGNPLAHMNTGESARFPAFGGEFQPGLYKPTTERKFANPAPLGLSAFALTTFVLGLINVQARGVSTPNIVVALAYGYGGLVQLLAGMWYVLGSAIIFKFHLLTLTREMAVGNTFGATALSSYGGFWISFAIVLTPGGFEISDAYTAAGDFDYAFGFFLFGWFIFTTVLLLCTLRSTVAFFLLFFFLDMAFLLLAIGYIIGGGAATNVNCIKAGGYFALFAAFMAWYNALAGIADSRYVQ